MGKPCAALSEDPKFNDEEYKRDSIECGEALAFSTLSAEYFVLWLAEVDGVEHHKYTGRAQYPRIVNKPIVPPSIKTNRYLTPDLNPVYGISNMLNAIYDCNGDKEEHIMYVQDIFWQPGM